jgi:uncharacterized protein involved in tolerance to divalent cations
MTTNQFTIKKIKQEALKFKGQENNVGVYESNISVTMELKLLACLDAITTKSGYGDRYKILMTDGFDYIYLKTNQENYNYLKNEVKKQYVYSITGNISLYNDEVELTVSNKPIYLENKVLEVNYDSFVEYKTLENVYDEINSLKLNCKGVAFSKLVKVDVKCLAKDINNTNLFFGNGEYIINVHGHSAVTNSFVKDNSYTLIGALSMHNFRPSLEFVTSTNSQDVSFTTDNLTTMKGSEFYKYTYETDEDPSYPNYSNLFKKPYLVTGYANSYLKSNKEYIVLEDNYNQNYYSSYTAAKNAKAIFFVNENYTGLEESKTQYCPMYEPLLSGTQIGVIVFPYLWNTQNYPQVYCYSFN